MYFLKKSSPFCFTLTRFILSLNSQFSSPRLWSYTLLCLICKTTFGSQGSHLYSIKTLGVLRSLCLYRLISIFYSRGTFSSTQQPWFPLLWRRHAFNCVWAWVSCVGTMMLPLAAPHRRRAVSPVSPTPWLSGVLCCSREMMVWGWSDREEGGAAV